MDTKMTYLQNHCKVTERLLWALMKVQLLTYHEKQNVEVKRTDLKRLHCLIETIRYKGPESYQQFCNALDKAGQDFVVNELTGRPLCGLWKESSSIIGTVDTRGQASSESDGGTTQKGQPIASPSDTSEATLLTSPFLNRDVVVSDAHTFDPNDSSGNGLCDGYVKPSTKSHHSTPHYFNIPSEAASFVPPAADEKWEPLHSSPDSKEILKVAKRLGRRWNDLIPFMEPNSEDLEVDARLIVDRRDKLEPEKAEIYLLKWKERFLDQATRYRLVKVLIERGQKLTADQVFGRELVRLVEQVSHVQGKT